MKMMSIFLMMILASSNNVLRNEAYEVLKVRKLLDLSFQVLLLFSGVFLYSGYSFYIWDCMFFPLCPLVVDETCLGALFLFYVEVLLEFWCSDVLLLFSFDQMWCQFFIFKVVLLGCLE